MASTIAKKIASTAEKQHDMFEMMNEADKKLCAQIEKYWTDLGFPFASCTGVAWSAVFVSWCVFKAGVGANKFLFAIRHSEFVHDAINNPRGYRGVMITAEAPDLGDIIHSNREGNTFDFAHAKGNKEYKSHSAIVVVLGSGTGGRYAITVGGNECDTIRMTVVPLKANGLIKQRQVNPFISVLRNQM